MKTMNKVDLTYSGKLNASINILKNKTMEVNYTIDGKTLQATTTSILIQDEPMLMITFNYQDLKKIVEGEDKE